MASLYGQLLTRKTRKPLAHTFLTGQCETLFSHTHAVGIEKLKMV